MISSAFGAWAGVLQAQSDGLIAPSQFTFAKGFLMFVAVGLGGYGRLLTPIIGSFLVVGVPELLDLGPGVSQIALGVLFVVVTIAVPGGLIGGAESLVRRLWRLSLPVAARAGGQRGRPIMTALLETRDVSKRFGGVAAVDGVSMSLELGDASSD